MSDDDIQYMGTSTSCIKVPGPFSVYMITLQVEKCAEQPAHSLAFHSFQTSTVHIGRRPGYDERGYGAGTDNPSHAMFRCPVMSRKHAKIAFADTGHAYLIDLNSHHGTHVLKAGETVSTPLTPEVPYVLCHDDTVTFGKSVGRGGTFVPPVTVRVELGIRPLTPVRSSVALPSIMPPTPPSENKPSPKNSGWYGLHDGDRCSSSPVSGGESDGIVEEVSPPPQCMPPTPLSASFGLISHHSDPFRLSRLCTSWDAIRRIVPTVKPYTDPSPQTDVDGSSSSSPQYESRSPSAEEIPSPFSLVDDPAGSSPCINPPTPPARDGNNPFEDGGVAAAVGRSRASSPMDLSSPAPSMSQSHSDSNAFGHRPVPISSSKSEEVRAESSGVAERVAPVETSSSRTNADQASSDAVPTANMQRIDSVDTKESAAEAQSVVIPSRTIYDPAPDLAGEMPSNAHEAAPIASNDEGKVSISYLQSVLSPIQADIRKLQSQRRKYRSRLTDSVCAAADQYSELDERITELNGQFLNLSDLSESLSTVDIHDLQARVDAIQDQVDSFEPLISKGVLDALMERTDVVDAVKALKQLQSEMQTLRDNAEVQIAAELEAVKRSRVIAVAAIEAEAQTIIAPSSLKRKRSMLEDDLRAGSVACDDASADHLTHSPAEPSVRALDAEHSSTTTSTTEGLAPPSKRAKSVASTVVHTATAVALGAVVTWGALAFS